MHTFHNTKLTHVKIRCTIKKYGIEICIMKCGREQHLILYFVFVILGLKKSVITLSIIHTICIDYNYNSNNTNICHINNTCVQF